MGSNNDQGGRGDSNIPNIQHAYDTDCTISAHVFVIVVTMDRVVK